MVVDEKSTGPFSLDEITLHPALTPDTLVWKPGFDNWVPAKSLPELIPAFSAPHEPNQTPPDFNSNFKEQNHQNNFDSRQHHYGNPGHDNFKHTPHNNFADNPQYRSDHSYQNHDNYYRHDPRYQNNYRPNFRTNWLPWAIVATVLGFFTSCIGAIFGIIGIVQANKANTFYARGFDAEGDAANSNARIMTIIGLIFAGLGIIAALWFGSVFSSLSNWSYL